MDKGVATLVADLIELALNTALRYNQIQREAAAEGREVNLDDVQKVQAENKARQEALEAQIAAMPD